MVVRLPFQSEALSMTISACKAIAGANRYDQFRATETVHGSNRKSSWAAECAVNVVDRCGQRF